MAQLDASLILAGRPLDVVGAMRQGNAAAMETNALRQQNQLANVYQTQGAAIMRGDQNALAGVAALDPGLAQGFQANARKMEILNAQEKRAIADAAAQMDAAQKEAAIAQTRQSVFQMIAAPTPEAFDQMAQAAGKPELVGQFENRKMLGAQYITEVSDLFKLVDGPEPPKPLSGQGKFAADQAAGFIPPDATYNSGAPSVTVNNGGGKFEEAFAKADADTLSTVATAGQAAIRNQGRIEQLDALLSSAPSGAGAALQQIAGEWGINTNGLDEIQSAQAIINSLVPEQRQPGSGPMSDADLALFKQSLPRIINQPGGNKVIVDTMRAIAQYDAEGAKIVQELRSGAIDRATAFDRLQNRQNPLANAGQAPAAPQAAPKRLTWDPVTESFK